MSKISQSSSEERNLSSKSLKRRKISELTDFVRGLPTVVVARDMLSE